MIHLRIKVTLPLVLVLLLALLAWLCRDPGTSRPQPKPRRPGRPPRRQTRELRESRDDVTYEDALRAPHGTYTADELDAIADREVYEGARGAYESYSDPTIATAIDRLKNWRPRHATD
jgi:hypothetical protein